MNSTQITMGTLLEELAEAGVATSAAAQPLPAALAPSADNEGSPWYVKAMVGIAAWVAASLLGVFFGVLGVIDSSEAMRNWGIGLLIVAIALKWWQRQNVFWGQLAFALILAGQALFFVGVGMLFEDNTLFALVIIALEFVLLLLYPDSLHRMLSVIAIVAATVYLAGDREWPEMIHAITFATAIGAVLLWQHELRLLTTRLHPFRAPLGYGLTFALFGLALVAFSGMYLPVQWWITSAALLLVLLYLIVQVMTELEVSLLSGAGLWALAAIAILAIPAYETPGILAAVIVLLLGRWRSNGLLLGIASIFLLFFLSSYYYYLEITLLNKSYILMGTGLALLAAWWGLHKVGSVEG